MVIRFILKIRFIIKVVLKVSFYVLIRMVLNFRDQFCLNCHGGLVGQFCFNHYGGLKRKFCLVVRVVLYITFVSL